MDGETQIRVLIAKPGLDGHDRGAKVVAMALRDTGMEVIYTGLHQTISAIVEVAIQEDVDVIGLSVLSGSHLALARKLMAALQASNAADKMIVMGGTISPEDAPKLEALGVKAVFPVGTPLSDIPKEIKALLQNHPADIGNVASTGSL
jgi:methylmalonyl-CoA mutase C-terminal domain/subunit